MRCGGEVGRLSLNFNAHAYITTHYIRWENETVDAENYFSTEIEYTTAFYFYEGIYGNFLPRNYVTFSWTGSGFPGTAIFFTKRHKYF